MLINYEQCMGCGNCLRWCPKHLLSLSKEMNHRGVNYCINTNIDECIHCGNCELMCTAGAIDTKQSNSGRSLIVPEIIPPHAGCSFGSITKVLADVIIELGIQDHIVLFKQKGADIGLSVETHDYTNEDYFEDGLKYKLENPSKIVIIVLAITKPSNRDLSIQRLRSLKNEKVTIIEVMSYYEANKNLDAVTNEMVHILEELVENSQASYIARGSVRSPQGMKQFERYMKKAIQKQINHENYSIIEMNYPCFFRLGNRPEKLMNANQISLYNHWFDQCVISNYPSFEKELK